VNNEDISSILEKLNIDKSSISQDSINNFLGMLGKNSNNTSSSNGGADPPPPNSDASNSNSENSIDMETLLKMKSIIDKMNVKDDPRSNLLMSLKPYLKESRKSKLDQYIQLMNMSKMVDIFPLMGGDKKKNE